MENIPITCKKCRVKVPIKLMKYDINGSDLICFDCYEKQVRGIKGKLSDFSSIENIAVRPSEARKKETKDTVKYYCTLCKFRFSRGREFGFPKNCPYCSKDSVEIWKDVDAATLLKEVEDVY